MRYRLDAEGKQRAITHSHTVASNGVENTLSDMGIEHDCSITPEVLLQTAYANGINVIFSTEHNNVKGYDAIVSVRDNHEKYRGITVIRGEEVSTVGKVQPHVLAYGISERIKPLMTIEETVDEIRRQGGVSCAPHAFAVSNGMREKAELCDIGEAFNSNNRDNWSNLKQVLFYKEKGMPMIAGSDSHVRSTIPLCTNLVDSENNPESILEALRSGRMQIESYSYASNRDMLEHAHYVFSNSRSVFVPYLENKWKSVGSKAIGVMDSFLRNPYTPKWERVANFGLYATSVASERANFGDGDMDVIVNRTPRNILTKIAPGLVKSKLSDLTGINSYSSRMAYANEVFNQELYGENYRKLLAAPTV